MKEALVNPVLPYPLRLRPLRSLLRSCRSRVRVTLVSPEPLKNIKMNGGNVACKMFMHGGASSKVLPTFKAILLLLE